MNDVSSAGRLSISIFACGLVGLVAFVGCNQQESCPPNQERCNGECKEVLVDAAHCGSCGNTCAEGGVCSSGECRSECVSGRKQCGSQCVDTETSDAHCGSCDSACDEGKGCVEGTCEPTIALDPAPDECEGGIPPIEVAFEEGGDDQCLGHVAERTFRWGLCSCDTPTFGNKLETDAYDSADGAYEPGGQGASVGTNGALTVENKAQIRGDVWATSGGVEFGNESDVAQRLRTGGGATFDNQAVVGGDADIGGDVAGKGSVEFQRTLRVEEGAEVFDGASYNEIERGAVDVPTACGGCDASDRIPVGSIVSNHSGSSNDNDVVGLEPDALMQPGERTSLKLPCGTYYLSGIDTEHKLSIVADGRVTLFVDGAVQAKNNLTIRPTAGSEFDMMVAGDVNFENNATVGSPVSPDSMRMYVGGDGGIQVGDDLDGGAYLYAMAGGMSVVDRLNLHGGIKASQFEAENDVAIHYDRSVLEAGSACDQRREEGDDPAVSCRGRGDSCGGSGECCAPLTCGGDGACRTSQCKHRGESCSGDDACCSGSCEEGTCTG